LPAKTLEAVVLCHFFIIPSFKFPPNSQRVTQPYHPFWNCINIALLNVPGSVGGKFGWNAHAGKVRRALLPESG